MYKNNTVNIQNGTPDTEYIDEFLSSFFSPPRGTERGFSGLCTWFLYTRTRMAFRSGVSAGAEGRGSSWDPPFPTEGLGAWAGGSPSVAGKTSNPSLGNVPSGGNDGGGS